MEARATALVDDTKILKIPEHLLQKIINKYPEIKQCIGKNATERL